MQVLFWEIFAFLYQSAALENYLDESTWFEMVTRIRYE